jgi:hypothetical protein
LIGKCEKGQSPTDFDVNPEGHEFWIRVAACVLAFVAILFLIIAGYVYLQDTRYNLPIRRFSSDTIRLIPSQENLFSFPNPIMGNETAMKQNPMAAPVSIIPSLSIHTSMGKVTTIEGAEVKKDAKRVRFNE